MSCALGRVRPSRAAAALAVCAVAAVLANAPSAWGQTKPAEASPPAASEVLPVKGLKSVWLVCEAVYLPTRATWRRMVTIRYDAQRVSEVAIDGLPVHAFDIVGTTIYTSLDNERMQIDTARQMWDSDFRGAATSHGRCERTVESAPNTAN